MTVPPASDNADADPPATTTEPGDSFTRSQDVTRRDAGAAIARRVPYVKVTMWPGAGEATVCVVVPPAEPADEDEGTEPVPTDPEAAWERANRRAVSRSRRYIVHNRLRFMWVLTRAGAGLHGAEGRAEMMRAVAGLVRKLRAAHGEFPYWYSPELHPGGHGWHCNLFLPDRLAHRDVAAAWGHGYVWAKDWTRDTRARGKTFADRLRAGATYGAKYAAKDWSADTLTGRAHRYEVGQGFEPTEVVAECRQLLDGVAVAIAHLGHPSAIWRSADEEGWDGPECVTLRFGQLRSSPT